MFSLVVSPQCNNQRQAAALKGKDWFSDCIGLCHYGTLSYSPITWGPQLPFNEP